MAITKINTGSSLIRFIQTEVGGVINIKLDSSINWITQGVLINIPEGGIYEVVETMFFNHKLKLKIPYKPTGSLIIAKTVFPISSLGSDGFMRLIYTVADGVNQVFPYEGQIQKIISIEVNGLSLRTAQYNIYESSFEILDLLSNTDYIEFKYYKK